MTRNPHIGDLVEELSLHGMAPTDYRLSDGQVLISVTTTTQVVARVEDGKFVADLVYYEAEDDSYDSDWYVCASDPLRHSPTTDVGASAVGIAEVCYDAFTGTRRTRSGIALPEEAPQR